MFDSKHARLMPLYGMLAMTHEADTTVIISQPVESYTLKIIQVVPPSNCCDSSCSPFELCTIVPHLCGFSHCCSLTLVPAVSLKLTHACGCSPGR